MIKQGDIFWLLLKGVNGFSSEYPHPHVVIQSHHDNVVLCALTTNMKKVNLPGNVLLEEGEANLPKESIVDVAQVVTVEKTQLGEYIGSLDKQRVEQILAGIEFLQKITRSSKKKGKTTMTIQDENIALTKAVYEYFNKHDWEKMAALYSDPADFKDPSFGQDVVKQSREQTVEKYKEMGEIFPDLRDDIVQIYPSGDKHVIIEFISSGTAPDGTKWTLPICTIFAIDNGQITKDFTYYDRK